MRDVERVAIHPSGMKIGIKTPDTAQYRTYEVQGVRDGGMVLLSVVSDGLEDNQLFGWRFYEDGGMLWDADVVLNRSFTNPLEEVETPCFHRALTAHKYVVESWGEMVEVFDRPWLSPLRPAMIALVTNGISAHLHVLNNVALDPESEQAAELVYGGGDLIGATRIQTDRRLAAIRAKLQTAIDLSIDELGRRQAIRQIYQEVQRRLGFVTYTTSEAALGFFPAFLKAAIFMEELFLAYQESEEEDYREALQVIMNGYQQAVLAFLVTFGNYVEELVEFIKSAPVQEGISLTSVLHADRLVAERVTEGFDFGVLRKEFTSRLESQIESTTPTSTTSSEEVEDEVAEPEKVAAATAPDFSG